jgi:uncharacterized protein (TIGR03083 family)
MSAHPPELVAAVPAGLRERVLETAQRSRAAGRPVPDAPEISPAEAFSRAADALYGMLCALDDDRWRVPALRDLDVQGLVGHLIGVESDTQSCLDGDQEVALADHVASTQPAADRQAGRSPAQTRADWRQAASLTLERVRECCERGRLGDEVAMHGIRLPLGTLLVVRAFELWTHENDIRRATGLPASAPDASTLRLMTDLAARLLPVGGCRTGLTTPVRVRLVLTGTGGGTWDVTLGSGPAGHADGAEPAVLRIVLGAVDFCRLAASRVDPGELDLHVTGSPDRAADVLAATAALALD